MAEVVGIVSGTITFATVIAQVGQSIILQKDCWNRIQDHVNDICESSEELRYGVLIQAQGTAEEFRFLQRNLFPSFYELPLLSRVRVAIHAV